MTIDVCATNATDALRFGATDSGLYVVTASDLRQVDRAAVTSCSIDVSAAPAVELGQTEPVTDVSGVDDALALSGATSGVTVNQATGNVAQCAVLTGPSGIDGDGSLTVIVGDAVQRLAVNRAGCDPDDSDAFADLAATSIAVGGSNRLALAGTSRSSGALELWVFNGPRNLTVLDGFGSIDGVGRCGDEWCVIDLAGALVHLVDADGVHLGTAVLNAALPSTVAEVLDVTSTSDDGMLALVRLSDGSSTILRLKA